MPDQFTHARPLTRILFVLLAACTAAAQTCTISGRVVDARGGESLSQVSVRLGDGTQRTITDDAGKFELSGAALGDTTLTVTTVGYHAVKLSLHLEPGETRQFEVVLSADNFRRSDTVEVSSGPFETARQDSPSALVLAGNDIKNLASVLADDPLRAVQSLPGVSSNNDFDARFSLRGADYNRIGLYLDDVLLHQPFHMLAGQSVTGSGAAFNGDMVEQLELHEGAFPQRFQDRSAGILDVHTREGSRNGIIFRAEASMSNAGGVAEGPLGKHGSWMVAARKSYLQYLISRLASNDTSLVFGLEDVQSRLGYDVNPANHLSLFLLESFSSLDRTSNKTLGINSLATAGYNYTLGNLGWRFAPSSKLAVSSHFAWMREKFDNLNVNKLRLGSGYYGEWVGTSNGSWVQSEHGTLDFGVAVRRMRDAGLAAQYQTLTAPPRLQNRYNGTGVLAGGFAQQSWTGLGGRLHLSAGIRGDRGPVNGIQTATPQASASFILSTSTRIQLGWGQYVQFPELAILTSTLGSRNLLPIRSNHVLAAVEQRFNERTRLRLELYNRADRDLPFQAFAEPRLVAGKVFVPPVSPLWYNAIRGYSRGVEIFLQRSSANRFNGWVSYAYGKTNQHDGVSGARFPSDYDQRHTVNIFAGYRLRPSVHASIHSSYGSGFPLPAWLSFSNGAYNLASQRSQLRLDYYQRTDFRVNKTWTHAKWKTTFYGELLNMTNRTNRIFDSLNSYNTTTGRTSISRDNMFPILPSVGILFER